MQEQLKRVKEPLKARTAGLSGAQTFLSTADRLSEVEALGIIRDLNENIFQLAVGLTDVWGKLESSQVNGRIVLDFTSRDRPPRSRPASLRPGPCGFDFPASVVSLLPGNGHGFEFGS